MPVLEVPVPVLVLEGVAVPVDEVPVLVEEGVVVVDEVGDAVGVGAGGNHVVDRDFAALGVCGLRRAHDLVVHGPGPLAPVVKDGSKRVKIGRYWPAFEPRPTVNWAGVMLRYLATAALGIHR